VKVGSNPQRADSYFLVHRLLLSKDSEFQKLLSLFCVGILFCEICCKLDEWIANWTGTAPFVLLMSAGDTDTLSHGIHFRRVSDLFTSKERLGSDDPNHEEATCLACSMHHKMMMIRNEGNLSRLYVVLHPSQSFVSCE